METNLNIEYQQSWLEKINIAYIAFLLLFFAETSYYLLILQTGIVDYFHSNIQQIWTIPIGGVLGIFSIFKIKNRTESVTLALFIQTLLMFIYPHYTLFTLFILGYSSGLVAPYLIYQLQDKKETLFILAGAYLLGTFAIHIASEHRGLLGILLSLIALLSSYFTLPHQQKKEDTLSIQRYLPLFFWLLLDATLFEILARSSMDIWRDEHFTITIALSHLLGLYIGYKLYNFNHNNRVILLLFGLSYLFFILHFSYLLAIVYPIVISYYNLIVLKYFMRLSFGQLTIASFSLWVSSGMGLFIALHI